MNCDKNKQQNKQLKRNLALHCAGDASGWELRSIFFSSESAGGFIRAKRRTTAVGAFAGTRTLGPVGGRLRRRTLSGEGRASFHCSSSRVLGTIAILAGAASNEVFPSEDRWSRYRSQRYSPRVLFAIPQQRPGSVFNSVPAALRQSSITRTRATSTPHFPRHPAPRRRARA